MRAPGVQPEALTVLGSTTQVVTTGHFDVHLTRSGFLVTQQWDGAIVAGSFAAKFRALEEAEALEARYVASRAR